ncbi:hypothetical protein GTHT12_01865 [Geobacillus thermodenitrificans]|jgi:hypothetical protein|nr:hypothetical protein GTHT12_01865 [Geobacillus thermodenitrificans]
MCLIHDLVDQVVEVDLCEKIEGVGVLWNLQIGTISFPFVEGLCDRLTKRFPE